MCHAVMDTENRGLSSPAPSLVLAQEPWGDWERHETDQLLLLSVLGLSCPSCQMAIFVKIKKTYLWGRIHPAVSFSVESLCKLLNQANAGRDGGFINTTCQTDPRSHGPRGLTFAVDFA